MDANREARNQQAARANQLAQADQGAQTAKTLSETPIEEGNALDQVLGQVVQ